MYLGNIVELADTKNFTIDQCTLHEALLSAIPTTDIEEKGCCSS